VAINEVTHVDGNRVSRNDGSRSVRLAELRTRLGRWECDSGGHRLCAMSKCEAGGCQGAASRKDGPVAHALSLSRVIGGAHHFRDLVPLSDSSHLPCRSSMHLSLKVLSYKES
jgi:hypothetical protein